LPIHGGVGVGAKGRRVCGAFSWIPGERGRSNVTRCGCGDLGFGRLGYRAVLSWDVGELQVGVSGLGWKCVTVRP